MWLIYKHTSKTSGKSYIGLTKVGMSRRWNQHTHDARKGSRLHFHNAIRLYGENDWVHTILEEGIESLIKANELELQYIKEYNTFEDGYNLTIGGDGASGVVWTKEKSDRRDSTKPVHKFIHYAYGLEELTLHKMCTKYGMSKGTLHGLVNGTKKSYRGWQMHSIVGDTPDNLEEDVTNHQFYHKDGYQELCSARELSDKYNLTYSKITEMIRGNSKYVKGWSLKEYELTYRHNSKKMIVRKWYNNKDNITETLSTSALARKYDLSTGSLTSVVKGRRNHHKNWVVAQEDTVMKKAKAVESEAKAEEHLASAELKKEQADVIAADFVKETSGQKRAELERDKEFDARVAAMGKESSKVQ